MFHFLVYFSLLKVLNHILLTLLLIPWFLEYIFHILFSIDYQPYLYHVNEQKALSSHVSIIYIDLLALITKILVKIYAI